MAALLDPAILFFVFGIVAGLLRSNLEIPPPIARFLSLYLLMALGLKGGFALAQSGLTIEVGMTLGAALFLAVLVPALGYGVLRRFLNGFDAAAVAATYGSVSAVTFITAVQMLDAQHISFGGHMAAAMALMESPAIVMAVLLANKARRATGAEGPQTGVGSLLKESLTDGAQLLLMGAMVVGMLSGEAGQQAMQPFSGDLFKGMLAFFLLDMGLQAARHMQALRSLHPGAWAYALLAPLVHASLALAVSWLLGLSVGDGVLLMALAASASYIAVPAVVRHAIPEANPALYLGMSLGMTFPFNILVGLPLYMKAAQAVLA
ncbi:MAG: sodium-dependent bicarbonate transport family permease [Ideonella sp. MAG2]|nr:MAG: sodium-dependent bicarbonate transport family permease [Ideonella sp. MAG2]